MIGVMTTIGTAIYPCMVHGKNVSARASLLSKPVLQFQTSTPPLHYSRPSSRGLRTQPRPMGVDSLLTRHTIKKDIFILFSIEFLRRCMGILCNKGSGCDYVFKPGSTPVLAKGALREVLDRDE